VILPEADREKLALSYRRDSLTPDEAKKLEGWEDPGLKAALKTKP
jgi:hypothetical protein